MAKLELGPLHTRNEYVAGDGSVLRAASVACTEKECGPLPSAGVVWDELHAAGMAPSTAHANAEFGSLEVNAKVGVVSWVSAPGPAVIVVWGGVVSPRNVAVTDRSSSRVTSHDPVPVQPPDHPANVAPGPGVTVSTTVVPAG